MSLALVHVNEGDEVLVKPISGELEVVERSTQEVETTSAVEVLEAQGILRGRGRESESLIIILLLYPTKMPAAMIIIRKDTNPNQSVARDKI